MMLALGAAQAALARHIHPEYPKCEDTIDRIMAVLDDYRVVGAGLRKIQDLLQGRIAQGLIPRPVEEAPRDGRRILLFAELASQYARNAFNDWVFAEWDEHENRWVLSPCDEETNIDSVHFWLDTREVFGRFTDPMVVEDCWLGRRGRKKIEPHEAAAQLELPELDQRGPRSDEG